MVQVTLVYPIMVQVKLVTMVYTIKFRAEVRIKPFLVATLSGCP